MEEFDWKGLSEDLDKNPEKKRVYCIKGSAKDEIEKSIREWKSIYVPNKSEKLTILLAGEHGMDVKIGDQTIRLLRMLTSNSINININIPKLPENFSILLNEFLIGIEIDIMIDEVFPIIIVLQLLGMKNMRQWIHGGRFNSVRMLKLFKYLGNLVKESCMASLVSDIFTVLSKEEDKLLRDEIVCAVALAGCYADFKKCTGEESLHVISPLQHFKSFSRKMAETGNIYGPEILLKGKKASKTLILLRGGSNIATFRPEELDDLESAVFMKAFHLSGAEPTTEELLNFNKKYPGVFPQALQTHLLYEGDLTYMFGTLTKDTIVEWAKSDIGDALGLAGSPRFRKDVENIGAYLFRLPSLLRYRLIAGWSNVYDPDILYLYMKLSVCTKICKGEKCFSEFLHFFDEDDTSMSTPATAMSICSPAPVVERSIGYDDDIIFETCVTKDVTQREDVVVVEKAIMQREDVIVVEKAITSKKRKREPVNNKNKRAKTNEQVFGIMDSVYTFLRKHPNEYKTLDEIRDYVKVDPKVVICGDTNQDDDWYDAKIKKAFFPNQRRCTKMGNIGNIEKQGSKSDLKYRWAGDVNSTILPIINS